MSGFPAAAGEEETAGGFLSSAARPRDVGKEMCHHPEGANPAGAATGGDQVGGGKFEQLPYSEYHRTLRTPIELLRERDCYSNSAMYTLFSEYD